MVECESVYDLVVVLLNVCFQHLKISDRFIYIVRFAISFVFSFVDFFMVYYTYDFHKHFQEQINTSEDIRRNEEYFNGMVTLGGKQGIASGVLFWISLIILITAFAFLVIFAKRFHGNTEGDIFYEIGVCVMITVGILLMLVCDVFILAYTTSVDMDNGNEVVDFMHENSRLGSALFIIGIIFIVHDVICLIAAWVHMDVVIKSFDIYTKGLYFYLSSGNV